MKQVEFESEDTIILGFHFRCNSRCRFCFVETELTQGARDISPKAFRRLLAFNLKRRIFRRLVLSGAEITLRPDLAELAHAAREQGGFQTVAIQTNARRLENRVYCRELQKAGISEYFVSMHAHTPALDLELTRAPKGFGEMTRGVKNLLQLGSRVISNTVICAGNHRCLPEIASFILDLGIRDSHFWFFVEMDGAANQRNQHARVGEAAPFLRQALSRMDRAGSAVTVKYFPKCLLGDYGRLLNNYQPPLLIRKAFQDRLPSRPDCVHKERCVCFGNGCDGLLESYRRLFGDEGTTLKPETKPAASPPS